MDKKGTRIVLNVICMKKMSLCIYFYSVWKNIFSVHLPILPSYTHLHMFLLSTNENFYICTIVVKNTFFVFNNKSPYLCILTLFTIVISFITLTYSS